MPSGAVANEVRTFSYRATVADLVTTAVGAQGEVTLHQLLADGWESHDVDVETLVAFDGAGPRVLDVGIAGAPTQMITALDVKAAAIKAPTVTRYRSSAPIAMAAKAKPTNQEGKLSRNSAGTAKFVPYCANPAA